MTKAKTELIDLAASEAALLAETAIAEMAKAQAPIIQRHGSHRERMEQERKLLESERFEIMSKLDALRRQVAALEEGLNLHLADVDAALSLYDSGLNSLPATL